MLIESKVRITCAVITLIIIVVGMLLRFFKYKNYKVEEERPITREVEKNGKIVKVTKIEKVSFIYQRKYERRIIDILLCLICWVFIVFGVGQPWNWVESYPAIGTFLTAFAVAVIFYFIIGIILSVFTSKKNYKKKYVVHADTKTKRGSSESVEYFTKDGKPYKKADSLKDAMNEKYIEILIDVEREKFWKWFVDGEEEEPIFADEIEYTINQQKIKTFVRDGGLITIGLLDSETEEEIEEKDGFIDLIDVQQTQIVKLTKEKNFLLAQRKVIMQEEVAERWAVIEKARKICEGTFEDEEIKDPLLTAPKREEKTEEVEQ